MLGTWPEWSEAEGVEGERKAEGAEDSSGSEEKESIHEDEQ
jgi:hypothetical protein